MAKQNRYFKELQKKVLIGLMSIIILKIIKNSIISGHDILKEINKEFNVLISSGTIYPILAKLKKQKLIEDVKKSGRKAYFSTRQGKLVRRSLTSRYLILQKILSSYLKK